MSRILQIAAALLAIVAVAVGLVLFLAYGTGSSPPGSARIPSLETDATIYWSERGSVHIEAASTADFVSALGYAHGMNRTWQVLLFRQIALGRAAEWLGAEWLPVDGLSRRLSFAEQARRAFAELPEEPRRKYEAYARGINAALESKSVRRQAAPVLLGLTPEPWEAWQSLAVERLWTWIAAPVDQLPADIDGVPELIEADHLLREKLHLFGMRDNMMVVAGGGSNLRHLFRYVTGDSGQPVFQEFEFVQNGTPRLDGLSIPGSFAVPAGRGPDRSWTLILAADIGVRQIPAPAERDVREEFERIQDDRGNESVVRAERTGGMLLLDETMPGDSIRTALTWTGFSDGSDAGAWSSLIEDREASFALLRSDGIVVDASGSPHIEGNPRTTYSHSSGVALASNSEFGAVLAARLARIVSGQTDVQSDWDLLRDTYSDAARDWNTAFVSAVDSLQGRSPEEDEALEYLRNWDLSYRGSSIAASILEFARSELTPAEQDSLTPAIAGRALSTAVTGLVTRFGSDMREWRWEAVQDLHVYFPGWSPPSTSDAKRVRQFKAEFVPVSVTGAGHPSTLAWGPTVGRSWRRAPAAWEGLLGHAPGSDFELERPRVVYSDFLGRFLAENRAIVSVHMRVDDAAQRKTRLVPSK